MAEKRICVPAPLARRPLRSGSYVAPTTYRRLLLEVAFKLRPWDVEELRFFVKDAIPDETAADALTVLGLLECLERHNLLGPGSGGHLYLRKYLEKMGREDLAALLAPPEELGGSATSARPSLPGPLSRIANRLGINSMVWPLSTYRMAALEVFRGLTEGEVEQIRWLSQDFFDARLDACCWSKEMSGVELLGAMENSALIGPGNYSFLIDCLEEIGRPDLVVLILPPSLPYLPDSLDIPALLNQKRIETIQLKKTQYQFGMQGLVKATEMAPRAAMNAGGWYKRILGALSPKTLEKHSSYIIECLPTTLINTSLHLNALLDGIQEYENNGDTVKFAEHISECEEHLDILQALMEKIDWDHLPRKRENIATSRQYHPVRQVSYGAFSGVTELLLEFSGSRERLQEESRHLNRELNRLESLLRLAGYMWSVTSWLIASLQVAARSPIDLRQYDFLFRILVRRNKHMIRSNSGMFEAVLGRTGAGRELLKTFRKDKLIIIDDATVKDDCSKAVQFHESATPIPVFVFVVLLLSEYPSLSPSDLEELIAALKDYISEKEQVFCQVNGVVTRMVLQGICKNIEAFRRSQLSEVQSESITEIFSV